MMEINMKNTDYKKDDRIRVLVGVFVDKTGIVNVVVPDQKKGVGVLVKGNSTITTWFRPHEIEKTR